MKNKKLVLTIFSLIVSLANINAQKKYSLEECIIHARENNLTVKQSRLNVEINENVKSSQVGNFFPDANLNGTYSYNKGFAIDPTTNQIQSAVNSFVFNGTSQWNLFDGLQNINKYRKAKFDLLAAQYNLEQLKDNISLQVADAYLQVILNKEFLKVAKSQVEVSEKEVERVSKLVKAGSLPQGDLYESEATFANDEQQLVATENSLTLSKLSLTQLLQIDYSNDFDIVDEDFPIPSLEMLNKSNEEVYDKALTNQYLIQSYENRIFSADKDLSIAKGIYSPSLSLVYQFSTRYTINREIYTYSEPDFIPIGQVQNTGETVVSLAPQSIPSGTETYDNWDQARDNKNHYLGINLRIPLFNRLQTRNNVRIKKLQLDQAELELDIQKNQLRQNIEKAKTDANASLKSYKASEKSLESLEEAFKYAQQKRDVGMISEYDYNQSRYRLVQAQSTMLRTKYDFIFKIKVLEYYYGERFNLTGSEN
ncbi:MAG: TolC family protein [Bacteroidota bacterium]